MEQLSDANPTGSEAISPVKCVCAGAVTNFLKADKFNSLREYPHLAARLRQRVSPREANIALQALLRRNEFEPVARLELFVQIASHFKTIVEFPQGATNGISDEQYVRNAVYRM